MVQGYPMMHRTYQRVHGYPLSLSNPQTHNHRVVHKMITDRDPLLPITCDKVRVRDYVRKKLGNGLAEEILIPIYHISKTGRDIPNDQWDQEFFLKANHGSKSNKIIPVGEDPLVVGQLAAQWLNQSYGQALHEWAYRDIPRRIICEKVLRDENGEIPMDIKFYCFYGKCKMVYYNKGRQKDSIRIISDEKRRVVDDLQSIGYTMMKEVPHFDNFQRMLEIAESLCQDFLFCRADLYSIGGKIYFGELTHYDGAGMERYDSFEMDLALGRLWLPENLHKGLLESLQEVLEEAALPTQ
jgi:hypothetical protein